MINKTKIIATLGPASNTRTVIQKMIAAGMNVARLNFSHGNYETHAESIKLIRSLSRTMNRHVGILLDLQGPKIRTGKLKDGGPVFLETGKTIRITTQDVSGTADKISATYKNLTSDTKKGDTILLDDGLIELVVMHKRKDVITCRIANGGWLKANKGINLPGVSVSAPSLTPKDIRDLNFGIKMGVDYFALSFVRSADDMIQIKQHIRKQGQDTPVIAKIEKPEAVDNLRAILQVADGIMVARGDLGVEMKPEKVPTIQKTIIKAAILANKPVITATQMLETMSVNPIPTRAEASDVANAIYDGTDAVMLSGETATGKYPVETVGMMTRIATRTERSMFMKYNLKHKKTPDDPVAHAIARSAVKILHELSAEGILAFSVSGSTARLISKNRPSEPVFAFSPSMPTCNQLTLVWGITPLYLPNIKDAKQLIEASEHMLVHKELAKTNDLIVIVIGLGFKKGSTNVIKIHRIGQDD
ncbi:pyruvate kinase [Thermodesulfobacteriota bacterium]